MGGFGKRDPTDPGEFFKAPEDIAFTPRKIKMLHLRIWAPERKRNII